MTADSIQFIDTHTGGEPTRIIISGGPDLGSGSMLERRERFRTEFDYLRSALVNEPRGSDVLVGALLCEPVNPDNAAGVIFFNNVGYLGMCGHGAIGLAIALYHQGIIGLGEQTIETPVGEIAIELHSANRASIRNVPCYRYKKQVPVEVERMGTLHGDIAWGGNWFFLLESPQPALLLENSAQLLDDCWQIRLALEAQGITGKDGALIDHVELFAPPSIPLQADSVNFVLCPGRAYDRSPCGTGTSAKLACLYADGKLELGQTWRQQSIIGSVFEGRLTRQGEALLPTITGEAFVNMKAEVIFDPNDPFRFGICPS